jgi:hypothetical protein
VVDERIAVRKGLAAKIGIQLDGIYCEGNLLGAIRTSPLFKVVSLLAVACNCLLSCALSNNVR